MPKVKALTYGLPLNRDQYERAKTILKVKFRKPSEITNPHIQYIMSLTTITQISLGKIHDFYEKLVTHSQSLDTRDKLK